MHEPHRRRHRNGDRSLTSATAINHRRGRPAVRSITFMLFLAGCATGPAPLALEAPTFCYRGLAQVVCYAEPDHGRENRLVGTYWRRIDPLRQAAGAP